MSIHVPCKDCNRRGPTCHTTCEDYKQYKREANYIKKLRRNDSAINDYFEKPARYARYKKGNPQ